MKQTSLLVFLFTLVWLTAFAQHSEIDSLKYELATARQDTSRVLIMAQLLDYYRLFKPDSAMKYGEQALSLSRQIKFPKGEAMALQAIAFVYRELGDLPKALSLALSGLRIGEERQYFEVIGSCNSTLGVIYFDLQDNIRARGYYGKAMKMAKQANNQREVFIQLGNIGATYITDNQLDSGIYYTKLSYEGLHSLKDTRRLPYSLRNLGRIQVKLGDHDLALNYFRQSIQAAFLNNDPRNAAFAYNEIAGLFQKIGQSDSCIYYAKKGLEQSQMGPFNLRILESSTLLAEAYKKKSDFKNAYEYQEMMVRTKEGLSGAGNIIAIQTMIADEEAHQQQVANDKVAYANRLRQYGLLAGVSVLLLIALILYWNNRQKQKANALLHQQKEEIQRTLTQLKSTQSQLIQAEKMASLGELTAGIAHEIQNPLNFVNNFSEVNRELVQEAIEELEKGDIEEIKSILIDLGENSEKINHHGKRADAIVKGMLEHSKRGAGQKEPTDINSMADDFLRLTYQSFLAKDPNFKVELQTNLDPDLPMISVIPQDIGKVLLNLYSNALYAVNERLRQTQPDSKYEPTVSVSTKKEGTKVFISVKDNGNGIPQKILDKIFQPFFTTKPTGQGTGLGLSLSYDIVKAHGGELKVETKEGKGSEFIIHLPA
jgi:signal transduction histidine kinase